MVAAPNPRHRRHGRVARPCGFTLIEMMVTIALVAIFSSLAAPSFREMIAARRAKAAVSAVSGALWLARSEAVKRNTPIDYAVNLVGGGEPRRGHHGRGGDAQALRLLALHGGVWKRHCRRAAHDALRR